MGGEFFVFQNVVGDAAGAHGGVVEEFEPVVRGGLEAKLFGPGAQGALIARRLEHLTLDLAPVARVVAVLQTKLAQAQPPARLRTFPPDILRLAWSPS